LNKNDVAKEVFYHNIKENIVLNRDDVIDDKSSIIARSEDFDFPSYIVNDCYQNIIHLFLLDYEIEKYLVIFLFANQKKNHQN